MTTYLTGDLYVFDTVSMEILKVEMVFKENEISKQNNLEMLRGMSEYNQYASESGYVNLKKVLEGNLKNRNRKSNMGRGDCGNEIHKNMKGLIQ